MKKIVFLMFAVVAMASCGNKPKGGAPDDDPTVMSEVADTLYTVEAVTRQVNAVYDYWNELRLQFSSDEQSGEEKPSLDERFGSKEWWQVRQVVAAIDRECECGGFFDFGDEGPLDAWTYDCYEGTVSADSIQVELQPDSTALVRFLVKDAVTIKGIPIRWLMRVEDGEWRVDNIIFEKDNDFDLLTNMRAYADNGGFVVTDELTFENMAGIYDSLDDEMNSVSRFALNKDGTATWGMVGSLHYTEYTYTISGNTICLTPKDIDSEDDSYEYDPDTRTLKNEQGAVYYRQIVE